MIEGGEEIFESCNNGYWKAPQEQKEDEAEIVIDLKCPIRLEAFSVINGFGDFGTKKVALFGSRNISGPWTELYRGELPPGTEMTEEVYIFLAIISKLHLVFSRKFSAARRLMAPKQPLREEQLHCKSKSLNLQLQQSQQLLLQ